MINQCELVMGKIIACKTTELESGNLKKITVDGKEIVMANVDGNYFDVYMNGLQPERYYQILIKTTISGSTIIMDDQYYFKVVNG